MILGKWVCSSCLGVEFNVERDWKVMSHGKCEVCVKAGLLMKAVGTQ